MLERKKGIAKKKDERKREEKGHSRFPTPFDGVKRCD
jgi:hypothetical protein